MSLRISIFIFALLYCGTAWGKVTIVGKIIGYDGKSLIYYHPTIEGIYTPYWKEVKASGNGIFKIEFENEGYGNTKISYKNTSYRFFHDTNSQIYFEIKEQQSVKRGKIASYKGYTSADSLKQTLIVKISGDYEAINKFYNRNLRSSYSTTQRVNGTYYANLIYNADTPSSAMAVLDSLKQIEIDQINHLPRTIDTENPDAEKKEREIRNFLIHEVDVFYSAVLLNSMFLKRKDHVIKLMTDSSANPNLYNRDWELLIEKLNEQAQTDLKATPNSPDYIDFMEAMAYTLTNYKQYDFPQNPAITPDEEVTNQLFNYDTILFRDKKSRLAYELSGVQRFLNDQLYYSPVLLHAIYDLQTKYPASKHFDFYKEKIEKLRNTLETSKQDFTSGKIINANFDSFDNLLKRFAGKNVLIDIWATWCHPCIEDFKHKAMIQPFIESDKIEMLYISMDKPQWEDRWRQSIKINELQGAHFRADEEFIQDMWNVIGDYIGVIPRYVLINKEGEIFRSTAARPSEGNELIREIELLINQKK